MKILKTMLLFAAALPMLANSQCSNWSSDDATKSVQGWSMAQTIAWYTQSQGSRLVPQAWIDHLEQADAAQPFLDPAYIARFRYLPNPTSGWSAPEASCPFDTKLPLGFTVDCQDDEKFTPTHLRWKAGQANNEPWVGMNCSACHTSVLSYQGKSMRFEGGPTMADFQGFTESLEKALRAAADDPQKFDRFAAGVLGANAAQGDRDMLMAALKTRNDWNARLAALNATDLRYGFGRLDAIGHIFNKTALLAMPQPDQKQLANPSDAPVSYPFLWNVPQLNKVEWNGLADNIPIANGVDVGALGRNTGEVIGVFGDVTIAPPAGALSGYVSSIQIPRLIEMEEQISWLQPPKWPAWLPPLDQAKVDRGRTLFTGKHCDTCHSVPSASWKRDDRYKVQLIQDFVPASFAAAPATPASLLQTPVGTDMWMSCNTVMDRAHSGAFKTAKAGFGGVETTADDAFNVSMVKNAVIGSILQEKGAVLATGLAGVFGIDRGLPPPHLGATFAAAASEAKEQRRTACLQFAHPEQIVYKARPLQGIWATAPYLHNGSVASLYELLLPAEKRMANFHVGTVEFDPKTVGYVTDASAAGNEFTFDTSLDGNKNAGHDYGNAQLSDDERWALVEYMKSL